MPIKFGQYPQNHETPTIDESFDSGYKSGYHWDRFYPHNDYEPGGPYEFHVQSHENVNQDWINFCVHTQHCRSAWLRGWRYG